MATTSIHIHSFPKELHDGWDPQRTLVLYPADDAVTLDELDPQDLAGVERLVLIDSRWNNTTRVLRL